MAFLLQEIIDTLKMRQLPTLQQVHRADELMRLEMIVAERKAVANRGTRGHFPVDAI